MRWNAHESGGHWPTFRGLTLLLLLPGLSGCAIYQGVSNHIAYSDTCDDFVLSWRNSAWASQAWHVHKNQFVGQHYLRAFGDGYRAGYIDVASGSGGCTPALPPRKYWSWKYQTPEGQAKVAAWFAGYPHGAKAAEEAMAGHFSQIQTSETIKAEYRLGHVPPYKAPYYRHDPAEWCRAHPEAIAPGSVFEVAPEEAIPPGATPQETVAPPVSPESSSQEMGGFAPAHRSAMRLPLADGREPLVVRLPSPQ